jgi:2'-hydroxyisoflavone reductase
VAAGGAYNVVGPTTTLGEVLAQCAAAADFGGVWATASEAFLAAEAVEPWAGPRSLPLWLPAAEAGLFGSTPDERAVAAGQHPRPLAETIADVLVDERHRGLDRPRRAGLTRGDELELICKLS